MRILLILCFCSVFLIPLSAGSQERTSPVEVGRHAPVMEFTDHSGTSYKIAWNGDERADIFFFFDPYSQASFLGLAFLESIFKSVGPYGVRIFAIEGSGLDEEGYVKTMERYHRLYGEPSFPVVLDPEYQLSKLFGIEATPSAYLLQRHGVTLYRSTDFNEADAVSLASRVERLLGTGEGLLSPSLKEIGVDSSLEKSQREAVAARGAQSRTSTKLLKVGDKVQPFEYTDLEGTTHRLSWNSGEKGLTIVFFWGSLCLPCIQEMGFLEKIYQEAEGFNIKIVAIEASGSSPEEAAAVIKRLERFERRPSYNIATDVGRTVSGIFGGIERIPQTFFISAEGSIIYHTDEFVREGAGSLARKIERAIGVDAGMLQDTGRGAAEAASPPDSADQSAERDEIFRSNFSQAENYFNTWKFDKALPHYLRCLDMRPNHAFLRERIAAIYERQGELESAIIQWQEVLNLKPGHTEAANRIKDLQSLQDRGGTGETRGKP
jgi:peroxiredoxin